jgi:hypothetical protein
MYHPVFYLKHYISESGFCLHLQVETTYLGPIDRASLYVWAPVKSQSHVTNDGQSVNMSWCQVHSGTCDQILFSV